MDKNTRFTYLLKKYLNNSCNRIEFNELFEFLKDPYYVEYLRESELLELLEQSNGKEYKAQLEKDASDELYHNILLAVKKRKKQSKNYSKSKIFGLAAVFIAIVCGGIFAFYWSNSNSEEFSSNHVVLEQEDGERIILDTIQSSSFVSRAGDTIQITQGNLIRYSEKVKREGTNTIHVPFGKTFQVELIDGSLVHLNSGSSLIYPLSFSQSNHREVALKGEAFFDIAQNLEKPFIVKTDRLNVQVLGTQFDVNAYEENKDIAVALLEGAVNMYDRVEVNSDRKKVLQPGDVGTFNKKNHTIKSGQQNVDNYISWRYNELIYRNVKVQDMFTKLERHFNIKIVNNREEISEKVLNANFGNQPIEDIIKYLSEIYDFKYSIKENEVTIN